MEVIEDLAQRAFEHTGHQDLVQLELRGDSLPNSASFILNGEQDDVY